MGIRVTGNTVRDLLSMGCLMAVGALGHDRFPVRFFRAVGVEGAMAFLAGKAVLSARFLEVAKQAGMTLGALAGGKRLRFGGVLLRCRRYRHLSAFASLRRCK